MNVREGQALALRESGKRYGDREIARDRPSRYGEDEVVFLSLRTFARDRPSPYG